MNNYKKLTINITVLTFLLTGGTNLAYADSSESTNNPENDTNREIALLESFEDNDYEAWKKYVGKNSNLAKFIVKDKFDKFIEIRSLARNGKYNTALNESDKFKTEIKKTLKAIAENETNENARSKAVKVLEKIKIVKKEAEKNLL